MHTVVKAEAADVEAAVAVVVVAVAVAVKLAQVVAVASDVLVPMVVVVVHLVVDRGHLGKGVYSTTSYGTVGRPGAPGSYNTSTIRGANGRHISTSRAYGLARADGGFGQVGTGRGSFRSSARRGSFGNRGGGGGVSRQTAAVAPPSGGDDGGDDSPTTPPGSGRERSLRIRNSPARRTAFGRGRRAQGSRRSLRIGRSVGGLGGGQSRSGVNV